MKNKPMLALVVAGAALAVAAWLTSREKIPAANARVGADVLPDLEINSVDEILISSATETVRVVRAESGWQLPERYYYPANFETIRRLLLSLDNLKIGQVITANEQQREKLELSAAATVLRLKAGGHPVAEIMLGASRQSQNTDAGPYGFGGMPDGRYIAISGTPWVYLVSDMLYEATPRQEQWLDSTLLDVQAATLTTIRFENPTDGQFTLRKDKEGTWNFDPADAAVPFDNTKAYLLTGALSYLTLQDVADPTRTDEELGFSDPIHHFHAEISDGTRYDLSISKPINESGDCYIRMAVGFEAPTLPDVGEGEDAINKKADAVIAADDAKVKAAALNTKLSSWTFRIASHKAQALTATRESMIKKSEPPPAADNVKSGDSDSAPANNTPPAADKTANEGTSHEQ